MSDYPTPTDCIALGMDTLRAGRIDCFEIHWADGRTSIVRREPEAKPKGKGRPK